MRIISLWCVFFLFLNCEDKQSSKNKKQEPIQTKSNKKEPVKHVIAVDKNEFTKLSSDNAMEFFLKYEKENKEDKVRITTDFGNIDIQLYSETKFHRANFIFLTKQGYFNGTQFYRVINNFIVLLYKYLCRQ